jgi:hypothetical protein
MRHKRIFAAVFLCTLGAFFSVPLLVTGCTSSSSSTTGQKSSETQATMAPKGGAQIWAENCMRCHNMRSPSSYSDTEWEVSVHHMRVIAGLTGEQQRAITEFLKSAN